MISFTCECGKPYRFSPKFRGQAFNCSNCGVRLTVPREGEEPVRPVHVQPAQELREVNVENTPMPQGNPEKNDPGAVSKPKTVELSPATAPDPLQSQSVDLYLQSLDPADFARCVVEIPSEPTPRAPKNAPAASSAPKEEYVVVSNSAPVFLKDYALQEPEDSGPPSEALSVILSREAVAQHLLSMEDTLGLRPTPVPLPPQRKLHKKRTRESEEPQSAPGKKATSPETPPFEHASRKRPNTLVYALLGTICILLLGIFFLLLGRVF